MIGTPPLGETVGEAKHYELYLLSNLALLLERLYFMVPSPLGKPARPFRRGVNPTTRGIDGWGFK